METKILLSNAEGMSKWTFLSLSLPCLYYFPNTLFFPCTFSLATFLVVLSPVYIHRAYISFYTFNQ